MLKYIASGEITVLTGIRRSPRLRYRSMTRRPRSRRRARSRRHRSPVLIAGLGIAALGLARLRK